MAIKLYDLAGAEVNRRFSPYCWRIRMALAHKGLSAETIPSRFSDKQVIAFSGSERVPVIVDGDRVVADSWAIANHLEDTYPDRPSLFEGTGGRALSLLVNGWADTVLLTGLSRFALLDVWRHVAEPDKAYFRAPRRSYWHHAGSLFAEREQHLPSFRQALEFLRRTLKGRETWRQSRHDSTLRDNRL